LSDLKKLLTPLLNKKCLGTSLGGSNGKRKAERTSSVQAVIRRINKTKKPKPAAEDNLPKNVQN